VKLSLVLVWDRSELPGLNFKAQDLPRLTFGNHLERTATNFAIGRETLEGDAGINDNFESLSAKGALDRFRHFHLFSVNLCLLKATAASQLQAHREAVALGSFYAT
jgi:hypothetical protein